MSTSTTNTFESHSTIREKGQITVPSNVRDFLDLQEGDRVAFIVNDDKRVEVMKQPSIVARTAGALKGLKPVLSAEEMRGVVENAIADQAIERAGK